jgi:Sap, sulfolipid-1-addressing protein
VTLDMWITLLAMAVAVSLEPFRIGMTILMINRPRPLLQLLAFLAGGFAMGIAVGVIVLFILRPAVGSAHFTLPRVQIIVGAVLLINAVVVGTGLVGRRGGDESAGLSSGRLKPLATRSRQLLNGRSLWTAGVAGLGIALPSIDYLAVLALIVASGAAASVQVGALVLFNVVAFGFVEIPLISYVVAPHRTRAALCALQNWLRTRRRRAVTILLAVVGCVLLGAGLAGL